MSVESQYLEYIGVYNADASVWGEVSYWFGARIGVRHCSLCDVTHGLFRKRADWVQCTESLGVAFTTYHRDDAGINSDCLIQFTNDVTHNCAIFWNVLSNTTRNHDAAWAGF